MSQSHHQVCVHVTAYDGKLFRQRTATEIKLEVRKAPLRRMKPNQIERIFDL